MKTIRIGKPKIKENNDRIRWSCAISGDFLNMSLYYETETKWGQYLTDDRLDAALVALIPYAMYRSNPEDRVEVICEAPVSEKLKFQLTQELMPALEKELEMAAKKHYKIPVGSRLSGLIKIIKNGFSEQIHIRIHLDHKFLRNRSDKVMNCL